MSKATNIGRKAVWLADSMVNLCVLVVILLLFVFGCYAVWDSSLVTQEASAQRYETYKPSAEGGDRNFQELRDINPDVISWLTVYGTHIDYPVVQGKDNQRYINTDAEGRYSLSGAIFLDCKNSPDFSDFNSILYGHHMEKEVMFGEIGNFADKDYFDARRYGMLYYGGAEHGVEFFAFFHCDGYDGKVYNPGITGRENQQAYLDMLLNMVIHLRKDVPVTTDSRMLLLSTCSSLTTNGRDVLVGIITDEVVDNPFKTELTGGTNQSVVSSASDLWTQMPTEAKALIAGGFLLLLILLLVILMRKRKQRRTYDEIPRAHDEAPHTHDGTPHTHDEAPRAHDEAPHTQDEAPHTQDKAPYTHDEKDR